MESDTGSSDGLCSSSGAGSSDDSDDSDSTHGMRSPSIGASHVIGKVRRMSRKMSAGMQVSLGMRERRTKSRQARHRRASGGRKNSGAHGDEDFGDEDEGYCPSLGGFVRVVMLCVALLLTVLCVTRPRGLNKGAAARAIHHNTPLDDMKVIWAAFDIASTPILSREPGQTEKYVAARALIQKHEKILEEQKADLAAGRPLQLACRSVAAMHALSEAGIGDTHVVSCARGCHLTKWFKEKTASYSMVWGDNNTPGYHVASLVCVAAYHATGQDGGLFTIRFAHHGQEDPSIASSRHSIATGKITEETQVFNVEATAHAAHEGDVKASRELEKLHQCYEEAAPFLGLQL